VASTIAISDVEANAELIGAAAAFMSQLEQPMEAAVRALEIGREAGVCTILNAATPQGPLPDGVDLLSKPFDFADLAQKLRSVFGD
jgi:ribokinase